PAGPSGDGAGAVVVVPALRPQSADVRAERLLRPAQGLREGDAARLSGRGDGQLHRAAPGSGGHGTGRRRARAFRTAMMNRTRAIATISVPRATKPAPSHQATPMPAAMSAR